MPRNTTSLSGSLSIPNHEVYRFYFLNLAQTEKCLLRNLILLNKGVKVLEIAVGAVFAPTRFSLVRISSRDLVSDGKCLVWSSGVGVGSQNLILTLASVSETHRLKDRARFQEHALAVSIWAGGR